MKKFCAVAAAFLISFSSLMPTHAQIDELIYKDPVKNSYIGRDDGSDFIKNLNFSDVGNGYWAQESIVRSGALDIVKGFGNNYGVSSVVTKQEAIAFALRAIGYEKKAQEAAVLVYEANPTSRNLENAWALGYLDMARQMGMISDVDFSTALGDQSLLNPDTDFVARSFAKREDVAYYLAMALQSVDANSLKSNESTQAINKFLDFQEISVNRAEFVEAVVENKIMLGDDTGRFRPKSGLTRSEMAQVLRNMDSIYYNIMGITEKTGLVSGIKDYQDTTMSDFELQREVYVRTSNGSVDLLKYQKDINSSPQAPTKDAVVLKDGVVSGLTSLKEGDKVEYLTKGGVLLYVQVTSSDIKDEYVEGNLRKIDFDTGKITISNDAGKEFSFTLAEGLYKVVDGVKYVTIDKKGQKLSEVPIGSKFKLHIKNNLVHEISFIGQITIEQEFRGIVTENNSEFGYISMITNTGVEVTKYYNEADLMVEKQMHYDLEDEIGYIDQVFPDFRYDPRDVPISEVEAGDIVFVRTDKDDPERITAISAATNYLMKYGKILELHDEDSFYRMTVEYEDKQTAYFDVVKEIFVSKDGKPIKTSDIQVGDYVRILVNQAIISPGHVIESAKELVIEGNEHFIYTIIKGQLAGLDQIQNKLKIQNAETLSMNGWGSHKQIADVNLKGKNIEFYHNGTRISLDFAINKLKRSDGEVYIALENNYSGEQVKKVTFRDGRDEFYKAEQVVSTNAGSFKIASIEDYISTDIGSIIVRNGRLVTGNDIKVGDYGAVSLNDGNFAAVVNISEEPSISGIILIRGRVNSVDDGKTFRVQSISMLDGMDWTYSPVSRDFSIDYNTIYITAEGVVPVDKFLSYTENSVKDKVFNILVDGTKATHIIDSPYAKEGVRGTIYEISDTEIKIKDATYFESKTGNWKKISDKDATALITIPVNSLIMKNNKIAFARDLQKGNQIRIMTNALPDKIASGMSVEGYIVLVEK